MKKTLCMILALLTMLLCACSKQEPVHENTSPPVNEESSTTATAQVVSPVPQEAPEATAVPTPTPVPQHSALYLPDYTVGQIIEYFNEVVLNVEYSDGTGDIFCVQKWTGPVYCQLYGNYTDEDISALAALFTQLNAVPGFPGICPASEERLQNMSISFLEPASLQESFYDVVNGEEINGATQFWYYTDTNELHTARIGCSTTIDQSVRNSVLVEEVINSLGISDTVLRPDSVVYQYSEENTGLSELDLLIFRLLYAPEILPGMNAEECAAVIQTLYY